MPRDSIQSLTPRRSVQDLPLVPRDGPPPPKYDPRRIRREKKAEELLRKEHEGEGSTAAGDAADKLEVVDMRAMPLILNS